jgi:DnaJ family protein A protein 5
MEKENKKQRQGEKKTFLKTVKDLVAYVKKRDPRFREYVVKQKDEEEKKNLERLEK